MKSDASVVITFVTPSTLLRELHRASELPMVGNGPPGTFVVFPHGLRVSLPTDQIVAADDTGGFVRVAFGGMTYVGVEDDQFVFVRVRELLPEEQLSPARSHVMRLLRSWVASITAGTLQVWPASAECRRA